MQALGAFVVYFTVYAQEGFRPSALINLRVEWEKDSVNDLEDSYGQEWVREGLCHQHPPGLPFSPPVPSLPRLIQSSHFPDNLNAAERVRVFSVHRAWGPLGYIGLAFGAIQPHPSH